MMITHIMPMFKVVRYPKGNVWESAFSTELEEGAGGEEGLNGVLAFTVNG